MVCLLSSDSIELQECGIAQSSSFCFFCIETIYSEKILRGKHDKKNAQSNGGQKERL